MWGPEPAPRLGKQTGPRSAPGTTTVRFHSEQSLWQVARIGLISEFRMQILRLIIQFLKEFRLQEDTGVGSEPKMCVRVCVRACMCMCVLRVVFWLQYTIFPFT